MEGKELPRQIEAVKLLQIRKWVFLLNSVSDESGRVMLCRFTGR